MTVIYIDTEKLGRQVPVFGIICSGMQEETIHGSVVSFKHPVDSEKVNISDSIRINPEEYTCSFFIADNPQNLLEQIIFLANPEFWKDMFSEIVRTFDETFVVGTGLEVNLQNSFSTFILNTIRDMRGKEVIVVSGFGREERMIIEDYTAVRSKEKKGIMFSLQLSKIYFGSKATTEMTVEKIEPAKSDTETQIKTDTKKDTGQLKEVDESTLVELGAPGATTSELQ